MCFAKDVYESTTSKNRGNFIDLIKILASYNEDIGEVVLENDPHNAKYTSSLIQNEILYIVARNVRNTIRDKIRDVKFCNIIVDEARDESKREQKNIVLRYF